jgi:dipeptidyl aminopeptidase/acylaminoacyl peptidase
MTTSDNTTRQLPQLAYGPPLAYGPSLAYGAWPSPLRAPALAAAALGLSYVTAHDGRLTWVEARPAERGRNALMSVVPCASEPVEHAAALNARSRVHEYGGRPYVRAGAQLLASRFEDQRLVDVATGQVLTAEGYRYADGAAAVGAAVTAAVTGDDDGVVYLVREDHTQAGEPINAIVALNTRTNTEQVLFDQADFVAYPRPSGNGWLAFIAWDHPNMPWDNTRLMVGRITSAGLADLTVVAGSADGAESVLEPVWDRDGSLYFLSDRSGRRGGHGGGNGVGDGDGGGDGDVNDDGSGRYWSLYRWHDGVTTCVFAPGADLGGPLWVLGLSTYALTGYGHALVRVNTRGDHRLALVTLASGDARWLELPFVTFDAVGLLDARTGFAVATPEDGAGALITFDLESGQQRVVRSAAPLLIAPEYVARGQPIEFPTAPGPDGAPRTAHAFFHAPRNPRCTGPADALPPLIVLLHGGPTSNATRGLSLTIQYWTTRGFAVVNVNYGGSSGFGRAYRERLRGQWGVVDLQDAVAAVDYLAASGRIDGSRVAIRGGSAGGYTVLSGLAFTRRFAVGINYFGVADLESLAADTHKFESRYLDTLVAPLPAGRAVYRARSPIHHLQQMDAALITFQGDEDRAVPPEQSRRIVEAVRARGKPVAYIEFKGEQHGFRDARNIARALEAELYFLGRIFGFTPADAVEPVPIENLPTAAAS